MMSNEQSTSDGPERLVKDTTTLRIKHNGIPSSARIDLVAPDGTVRPLELVRRIAFESDAEANVPSKVSLDMVFCFGTLEIDIPVTGETVSRIVASEQGLALRNAVGAVPPGAIVDAPDWVQRLYGAACAVAEYDPKVM